MTSSPLSPHPDRPADASHPAQTADASHQARTADGGHATPPADANRPAHLVHTAAALRDLPRSTGVRAVVMTMGALHEGHATLVRAARRRVAARARSSSRSSSIRCSSAPGRTSTAIRAPWTRISSWPPRRAPTWSSPRPSTRSTRAENRRSGSPRAPWAPSWKAPAAPGTSTAY